MRKRFSTSRRRHREGEKSATLKKNDEQNRMASLNARLLNGFHQYRRVSFAPGGTEKTCAINIVAVA